MPKIRRLAGYVHCKGRRQRTVHPSRRIGFERIKIVAPQTLEIGPAGDGRDGDHPLFAVRASGYVHQKLLRYQTAHQPSVGTKVPSVPVRRGLQWPMHSSKAASSLLESLLMAKDDVRRGMPPVKLSREEFDERYRTRFIDPLCEPLQKELDAIIEAA